MVSLVGIEESLAEHFDDAVRITVVLRQEGGQRHAIWFEIPREVRTDGRFDNDMSAVLGFLVAAQMGEDLRIPGGVDAVLQDNLHGIGQVLHLWYPRFNVPRIDADPIKRCSRQKESILFFTGGVDSFASLIRLCRTPLSEAIDSAPPNLVTVWGFDIPIDSPREFEESWRTTEVAAVNFGCKPVAVATNLRELDVFKGPWGEVSHGFALGAVAHLLSEYASSAVIAATHDYANLMPWGSHPLTDPLLSSGSMRLIHDGASMNRLEKTSLIARYTDALPYLRVCWESRGAKNCSNCKKCLRAMAAIDIIDARADSTGFDWSKYTPKKIKSCYLRSKNDRVFASELRDEARIRGREDLAAAFDSSISRSAYLGLVEGVLVRGQRIPIVGRYIAKFKNWLLN